MCRQLGYIGTVRASTNAEFGQGTETIWMDNVTCNGSETALDKCPFNGWDINNCVHINDAGVVCQGRKVFCIFVKFMCTCVVYAENVTMVCVQSICTCIKWNA